ncbi:MAG: 6-phosphofructokinase, partial [Eubacteriales bacterium]
MNLDGNAIVGQSGGPTAAINASLSGVIRGAAELHAAGAIKRLYGMRYGVEGLLSGRITDLTGLFGDEKSLSLLEQTPASALGSCRMKLPEPDATNEIYLTLLEVLRAHDIRFFFYIGGNDSMDTVDKLTQFSALVGYELRVIGVPKTID